MDAVDDSTNGGDRHDEKRTQTIESLNAYIQAQRALLERTQRDINRLCDLKRLATEDPKRAFENILGENVESEAERSDAMDIDDGDFSRAAINISPLSELVEEVGNDGGRRILETVDWELFKGHDPTQLRNLAFSCRRAHPLSVMPPHEEMSQQTKNPPNLAHRSSDTPGSSRESDLQLLVRQHRATIIDPALELAAAFLASFPADSDDGEEGKGKGKKGKDKDANKRRKASCGLTIRARGPGGVFVRKDADESADVDISDVRSPPPFSPAPRVPRRRSASTASMNVDSPIVSHEPLATSKPKRTRRPSIKLREGPGSIHAQSVGAITPSSTSRQASSSRAPTPKLPVKLTLKIPPRPALPHENGSRARAQFSPNTATTASDQVGGGERYSDQEAESEPPSASINGHFRDAVEGTEAGGKTANGKLKSGTYKIPWSISEQHLLEKLLEEIPEGERNRWSQISAAMQGRRTPRQVASRVQKFFNKLKKWGVEVAGT